MNRLENSFVSLEQMQDTYFNKIDRQSKVTTEGLSFSQIFENVSESHNQVTFSKHANDRLASRNINLNDEQLNRLNKGVMQAKEKSINESLVMMDDIAFIVNIKNNTVITAMDQANNDNNVFTNIDGAVIV